MARTLLLTLLFLAGCGPIRATVGLVDAERAVRDAKAAGAAEHAVYPLTLAEGLLAKAIEEKGYAEWEQSFLLAEQAVKHAQDATELCQKAVAAPLWPDAGGASTDPEAAEPPDGDDDDALDAPSLDDDDSAASDDDDSAASGDSANPWTTEP